MSITNSRVRPFDAMPAEARLWIFAAADAPDAHTSEALLARVDDFLDEWNAHGSPVVGARDWRYDRFLLIAADEAATGVSGCSTDSLFRVLKMAERELGMNLLDGSRVWYRGADGIHSETRGEFRERLRSGAVGADTVVFDNTARTVGDIEAGRWERPLDESWHSRL